MLRGLRLRVFVEINGRSWARYPPVDAAEQVVLAIASGDWDEERTAEWLGEHLASDQES